MKRPKCELDFIFVGPNGGLKMISPKTRHRVRMHICGSKCTSHKFVYTTFVTKP